MVGLFVDCLYNNQSGQIFSSFMFYKSNVLIDNSSTVIFRTVLKDRYLKKYFWGAYYLRVYVKVF